MKKALQILAAVMAMVTVLSLVGCSNFNKVQKAFEKEDYVLVEDIEEANEALIAAYLDETKQEELGITIKAHLFKKSISYVAVLEFDCSKEKMEEYMESETLVGVFKDLQNSEFVNGTCVLLPILSATPVIGDPDVVKIFKNA